MSTIILTFNLPVPKDDASMTKPVPAPSFDAVSVDATALVPLVDVASPEPAANVVPFAKVPPDAA